MIFKCVVKHDGIIYPAGSDVPVGNTPIVKEEPKKMVDEVVDTPVEKVEKKATKTRKK